MTPRKVVLCGPLMSLVLYSQLQLVFLTNTCHFPGAVQFAQSCPTLCDPMNRSTPGLPVHHHLPEFTQTHVHRVGDAIQPSHPRSSPSPPAPNPSQHQSFPVSQPFSNYFQRNPRADLLHNRLVGSPCSPRVCHLYPFILRTYEGCSGGHQMFFIFLIEDQPTWSSND